MRFQKVIYRSCWCEGVVDTEATLDMSTGEVIDIEQCTEEEMQGMECHEHDIIMTLDGSNETFVEDFNGFEYSIETDFIYLFQSNTPAVAVSHLTNEI